ncbi:acid sphingomyelinase-like phosphodiesterase 3b [Grus japonensis]|uniref:Acid sphingomyelinase-like phosphodiesterase 3b n=1 Tax=Grus japonensis TaxID=30415 RepID=A0ABC9WSU4_GRUJA
MPAGSKMDPPLAKAKAKPISASVITSLRREKKPVRESFCSRREEREDVRNSADTKVSAEGGGGGAPGAGAEIPLQPVVKAMVKQAVPLQPIEEG